MGKVPLHIVLLSLLLATACSAPNQSKHQPFKPTSGSPGHELSSMDEGVEGTRTLVTLTILSWIMNIFKAMVKPARDMYISFLPEISAVRCLSESREVQSMFGYNLDSSDDNFEGKVGQLRTIKGTRNGGGGWIGDGVAGNCNQKGSFNMNININKKSLTSTILISSIVHLLRSIA